MKSLKQFFSFHLSSLSSTLIDFIVYLSCSEGLHFNKSLAITLGAICGGVSNYSINRKLIFKTSKSVKETSWKYFFVSVGSLLWNLFYFNLLLGYLGDEYHILIRVFVSFLVGVCWNFFLQKYWVFRA